MEKVDLNALAGEVLDLLHPQLDHLSVTVEKRLAGAQEVCIDRNVFRRAIMNLVLNGAQAMPQGGRLEVGTARENGRVRFFVKDCGPGITEEQADRLFEPFYTTKEGGIGLGLAVTKRIVEDHGGKVGFSTSKEGTTFWADLPPTGDG